MRDFGGNSGHRPELDNSPSHQREKNCDYINRGGWDDRRERPPSSYKLDGIKPKDLVGIPWMVAFALRADGWYLRSDIVWAKGVSGQKELSRQILEAALKSGASEDLANKILAELDLYVGNSMPESVKDRPSRSHEYLFLFSKSKKYYYDTDAIREPLSSSIHSPGNKTTGKISIGNRDRLGGTLDPNRTWGDPAGRNRRSVWTITAKPFKGAHFATFPEALIEPCILAGTSEKGVCPECGKPWVRQVKLGEVVSTGGSSKGARAKIEWRGEVTPQKQAHSMFSGDMKQREHITMGWLPSCSCGLDPVPAIILDPFGGAGTTGLVANKFGRNYILIDLNKDYCKMAEERIRKFSN